MSETKKKTKIAKTHFNNVQFTNQMYLFCHALAILNIIIFAWDFGTFLFDKFYDIDTVAAWYHAVATMVIRFVVDFFFYFCCSLLRCINGKTTK